MAFAFGNAPATGSNASAAPNFSFGSPAGTPAVPSFSFGSKAANTPSAAPIFGTTSAPAPSNGTPSAAFSLGGSAPAGDASKKTSSGSGAFVFGGSGAPASFNFQQTSAPAASSGTGSSAAFSLAGPSTTAGSSEGFNLGGPSTASGPSGAFNFGGSSAASSDKKEPPSSSGFAFAAAAPSTEGFRFGASSDAKGADVTPAAVTAGVANPVSLDQSKSSTTAPSTPPGSATTGVEVRPPPPVEYMSLTLEQILNKFQSELEQDATLFLKNAQRVAHYDAVLRDSQRSISHITHQVSRLMIHQSDLDRTLSGVGTYQYDLGTNLDALEVQVEELFAAQSHLVPEDSDVEREKSYAMAMDVMARMEGMKNGMDVLVNDLNAAQERVFGSYGDEDVGKIVQILNKHHDTLAYLEAKSRVLEGDIALVGRSLYDHQ